MKTQTKKIPKGWKEMRLGDVCEILDSRRKPINKHTRVSGEYPYYGAVGILDYINDYIFDEKLVLVGEDGAKWKSGDNTAFIAKGKYWVNNHAHVLKPKRDIVIDELLVAILNQMDISAYITGTTVLKLNQANLHLIKIHLPPLPEQKAIAGVLGSLDDKIELLRQQNQTLEEIGQTLFHKWFGGYQVDNKLPNGWNVGKIKEIVDFLSGFPFNNTDFHPSNAKYRLVTIKNVQDGYLKKSNMNYIEKIPKNMPKHCFLKRGDILLSLTGNVGRCCFVDTDNLLLNQRVSKLVPKKENYLTFIYILFRQKNMQRKLQSMAHGTAQANLSPIKTAEMEMVIPSQEILEKFSNITKPLFHKIQHNTQHIQTLETMRDTLLPKLVSGEVRVKKFSK